MEPDKTRVRNAATVIVLRDRATAPAVLMGQRGANAVFMPNKYVFPGGAVDASDSDIALHAPIKEPCATRLTENSAPALVTALSVAAIRELWEETGQILGRPGQWRGPIPEDWQSFAATGHVPDASPLQFVFRALTPPGRPRRFDARFFLIDASDLASDIDDFSAATDELSHLQWIPIEEVRRFDLPFITEVVLAEVNARLDDPSAPVSVPYFRNTDEESLFLRLHGHPMPND